MQYYLFTIRFGKILCNVTLYKNRKNVLCYQVATNIMFFDTPDLIDTLINNNRRSLNQLHFEILYL